MATLMIQAKTSTTPIFDRSGLAVTAPTPGQRVVGAVIRPGSGARLNPLRPGSETPQRIAPRLQ